TLARGQPRSESNVEHGTRQTIDADATGLARARIDAQEDGHLDVIECDADTRVGIVRPLSRVQDFDGGSEWARSIPVDEEPADEAGPPGELVDRGIRAERREQRAGLHADAYPFTFVGLGLSRRGVPQQ